MKILSCIVVLFLWMGPLSANPTKKQSDSTKALKLSAYGIYFGYNNTYNALQVPGGTVHAFGLSPMFGAHAIFDLKPHWQLETGIGFMEYDSKYIRYGQSAQSKSSPDTTFFTDGLMTSAYYISVPIMAQYELTTRSRLVSGLRFSDRISSAATPLSGYKTGNAVYEQTMPGNAQSAPAIAVNKFDFGFILGYEYHFSDYLFASFLYNIGTVPLVSKATVASQSAAGSTSGNSNYFYPVSGNYNNSLSVSFCFNLAVLGEEKFSILWHRGRHWRKLRFPSI